MKKSFLIILFLMMFTGSAYASDIDDELLYNDNAKIFTATIVNVTSVTIDIKVIHKIKGDVLENETLTLPYFEYDCI